MTWPCVVALALLIAGAVTAAAFGNNVIAATLAGAAAGSAVNRDANPARSPSAAAGDRKNS